MWNSSFSFFNRHRENYYKKICRTFHFIIHIKASRQRKWYIYIYIYRFFNVACNKDAAHFFDPPHHGLIWHSSIPFSLTSDHKHQKSPSRGRYLPFSSIRGTRWPRKPSPPPPSSPALVNFPIVASGFNGSNRINTRIRPRILARNNEFKKKKNLIKI